LKLKLASLTGVQSAIQFENDRQTKTLRNPELNFHQQDYSRLGCCQNQTFLQREKEAQPIIAIFLNRYPPSYFY
jgi:Asp-tRNA(Asn)/Glu-tRNA(Gln) amidotransferase B subunit